MTRKDYIAIARAFATAGTTTLDGVHLPTLRLLADRVADVMEADNPNFDRAKFLTACGV